MPFVNMNYGQNDTVDPNNVTKISAAKYTGFGIGGGVDVNYQKRFGNYNGVGIQIVQDGWQVGSLQSSSPVSVTRYYNVGTTYWLTHNIALGLRYAEWVLAQPNQGVGGATVAGTTNVGERSVIGTLRIVL